MYNLVIIGCDRVEVDRLIDGSSGVQDAIRTVYQLGYIPIMVSGPGWGWDWVSQEIQVMVKDERRKEKRRGEEFLEFPFDAFNSEV